MLAGCVENMQAVSPCKFALYREDGIAVLIVDIVAVEPREKALLE